MAANFVHSTGPLHLAVVWGILTLFVHLSAAQTTAAADEGERILKRRADDAWFLEKSVRFLFHFLFHFLFDFLSQFLSLLAL